MSADTSTADRMALRVGDGGDSIWRKIKDQIEQERGKGKERTGDWKGWQSMEEMFMLNESTSAFTITEESSPQIEEERGRRMTVMERREKIK